MIFRLAVAAVCALGLQAAPQKPAAGDRQTRESAARPAAAKEKTPIELYRERAEEQRQAAIAELADSIKGRMAEARKAAGAREEKKRRGDEIAAMKRSLELLRKNEPPFVPTIEVLKIKVGDVGRLDCGDDVKTRAIADSRGLHVIGGQTAVRLWIIDVRGPKEFVVEPIYYTNRTADNPGRKMRVRPLLIRGVETDGLVTDRVVELGHVFHVSGTADYGAERVFVVEVVEGF